MKYSFILLLFLFACTNEQSKNEDEKDVVKRKMPLTIKIKCEAENSYTIAWYDTLGKQQNLSKSDRPFHLTCAIMDSKDTAGYYNGLINPSTWTSFGTKDSIVSVYFSIARNQFSQLPMEEQKKYPDISCEFLPVQLNVKSNLEERINLQLTEK